MGCAVTLCLEAPLNCTLGPFSFNPLGAGQIVLISLIITLFNPLGGGQIALLAIVLLSSYVMCCLPCCLACCMDDVKGEQRKAHTYRYPPTYKFPIIIILLCACTYITLLSMHSGIVDHTPCIAVSVIHEFHCVTSCSQLSLCCGCTFSELKDAGYTAG